MTTANSAIVALLVDVDPTKGQFPVRCFHKDGRPFTAEEQELILDTSILEYEAAKRYMQAKVEYAESSYADSKRLGELLRPYWESHGRHLKAGEIRELMTPEEQAEYDGLVDRMAPDGTLIL